MRVSFLEIYNEDVRDLLSSNPRTALDVREDAVGGVFVKGLHAFVVKSPAEISNVLQVGALTHQEKQGAWHALSKHAEGTTSLFSLTLTVTQAPGHLLCVLNVPVGKRAGGQAESGGWRDAHESRLITLACDIYHHCRAC